MTKVVQSGTLPPSPTYKRGPGSGERWDAVAKALQEHPEIPVLLDNFAQMPHALSAVTIINRRSHLPVVLRNMGGTFRASMRNADYKQRGVVADVFITWTPDEGDAHE